MDEIYPMDISEQSITGCRLCGTCCRKGGPALHLADQELVNPAKFPWLLFSRSAAANQPLNSGKNSENSNSPIPPIPGAIRNSGNSGDTLLIYSLWTRFL
jgi:hypothetical protein